MTRTLVPLDAAFVSGSSASSCAPLARCRGSAQLLGAFGEVPGLDT